MSARFSAWALPILCSAMLALLGARAHYSPITYDEAITLLEVSGKALPPWPAQAQPVSDLRRDLLEGTTSFASVLHGLVQTDVHPPLYYWLLLAWRGVLGRSLEVARWFSVACSLVTALIVVRLARDSRIPWLAGVLYGFAGTTIIIGFLARPYALATLLVALMALCATRPPSRWTTVLTGLAGGAAFATHYFALFPVVAILAMYCILNWSASRGRAVSAVVIWALVSLPLVPLLQKAVQMRPGQYAGFRGLLIEFKSVVRAACLQLVYQPEMFGQWGARITIWVLALGLLASICYSVFRLRTIRNGPTLFALLAVVSHLAAMLTLFAITNKTLSEPPAAAVRYVSIVSPFIVLLVVTLLDRLPQFARALTAGALGLALASQTGRADLTAWGVRDIRQHRVPPHSTVVVGQGDGRGIAAMVLHQLPGDAKLCVLTVAAACLAEIPYAQFFVRSEPHSLTAEAELRYLECCRQCEVLE